MNWLKKLSKWDYLYAIIGIIAIYLLGTWIFSSNTYWTNVLCGICFIAGTAVGVFIAYIVLVKIKGYTKQIEE